jgi:hypothetical protein
MIAEGFYHNKMKEYQSTHSFLSNSILNTLLHHKR